MNNQKEVWLPVKGYEGFYEVSNFGNVLNVAKNRLLTKSVRGSYYRVTLFKSNNKNLKSIHRLVAESFIDNPMTKKEVNHIDFNGFNNCASNLEWVTPKENIKHSRINNRYPKMKISKSHMEKLKKSNSKKVLNKDNGDIYNSVTEAANKLGYKKSTLIHYLIGSRVNKTNLQYL